MPDYSFHHANHANQLPYCLHEASPEQLFPYHCSPSLKGSYSFFDHSLLPNKTLSRRYTPEKKPAPKGQAFVVWHRPARSIRHFDSPAVRSRADRWLCATRLPVLYLFRWLWEFLFCLWFGYRVCFLVTTETLVFAFLHLPIKKQHIYHDKFSCNLNNLIIFVQWKECKQSLR